MKVRSSHVTVILMDINTEWRNCCNVYVIRSYKRYYREPEWESSIFYESFELTRLKKKETFYLLLTEGPTWCPNTLKERTLRD